MIYFKLILSLFLLNELSTFVNSQLQPCEVCIDVLSDVMKLVNAMTQSSDPIKIRKIIRNTFFTYCTSIAGVDTKKEKLCNFLGAHKDSAASTLNDIVIPLSFHKPVAKICQEIKDDEVCAVKYDKPIDWESLDLSKMRVKQLKDLLLKLGDTCKGCTEKQDYITRINELKPKEEL